MSHPYRGIDNLLNSTPIKSVPSVPPKVGGICGIQKDRNPTSTSPCSVMKIFVAAREKPRTNRGDQRQCGKPKSPNNRAENRLSPHKHLITLNLKCIQS